MQKETENSVHIPTVFGLHDAVILAFKT